MERSLDVVGVRYRYPKADDDTLRGIDLTFPAGSFTVVMGQTGAGKSTLLMTLNGVIPHLKEGTLSGEVRLDYVDLASFRVQTITEFVGLVLQDPESQILGRTVAEDVAFGPRNYLVPRDEIVARITRSLADVALTGFENRETAQLSGGQKQRLAIAGILALEPEVLCLDEPTSELDPAGRAEIYAVTDALRAAGATIIAVEHASADVVGRADHLVVLKAGQVAWQGAPAEFFRDPEQVAANMVKPLPVALVGAELAAAGLIAQDQIPLDVDTAVRLVETLAAGRSLPAPRAASAGITVAPGEPVIEVRGLHHTYPAGVEALAGVDLAIGAGEYVAIVGRNGAGKTTLAKHFNGIFKPTAGEVLVHGRSTLAQPSWELARQVGYVFQNPDHQIFNSTVAEEVGYGLKLAGLPATEIDSRITEVLGFTGLLGVRDEHPFSLGKGERQRVAVASILALQPGILVVDEPTTGQDWAGVGQMMALIDRLNAAGTTIVMVTHDMDVVARHARRVIVMDAGLVLADGPTAEVLAQQEVLARAAVAAPEPVALSRRLWPDATPLLDATDLGRHLAAVLGEGRP